MTLRKDGVTLIEIIVVLVIIGIATALVLNYTVPTQKARAASAENNLLAIYGAQQNYNNNNSSYCIAANAVCNSLASINTNLSLSIQDDGTYTYSCATVGAVTSCTATNVSSGGTIVLKLNSPTDLAGGTNPKCNLLNNWCP